MNSPNVNSPQSASILKPEKSASLSATTLFAFCSRVARPEVWVSLPAQPQWMPLWIKVQLLKIQLIKIQLIKIQLLKIQIRHPQIQIRHPRPPPATPAMTRM